jgi:hypothetical protein
LTCPAENLDTLGGQFSAVDVMVFEHAMTTSCGPAGDSIAGPTQAPAATFSWTSPGLGVLGCNIFLSSGFPASFSLQEGTCDGPEVQCSASEPDGNGRHSAGPLSIDQIPETEFTITVQPSTMNGLVWADGGFELFVGCFIQ